MNIISAQFGPLGGPFMASTEEQATGLVVLLHGYGANGLDLFGLAEPLRAALQNSGLAVWSPNAPEILPGAGQFMAQEAYQWFPITSLDRRQLAGGVQQVAPLAQEAILAAAAQLIVPLSNVAVVGFSQGGMVALEACLTMDQPVAAVVGLSTAYLGVGREALVTARPPVTLVHGDADPVVEPSSLAFAVDGLKAAGIDADHHMLPGLQHGIDQRAFELAVKAVAAVL